MFEFIECVECGFVLLAGSSTEPVPERRASCPECGGSEFRFTDE